MKIPVMGQQAHFLPSHRIGLGRRCARRCPRASPQPSWSSSAPALPFCDPCRFRRYVLDVVEGVYDCYYCFNS